MDSSSSDEDDDEDIEDEEKDDDDDDDDHSDAESPSPALVDANVKSVPRMTPPVAPVVKPAEANDEDSVTGTTIEPFDNGC